MVPEPTIIFSPAISSALSILLSGLVNAVQAALNGAIASGDYAKVLNRWGEGVESIPQSEINPPGLGD